MPTDTLFMTHQQEDHLALAKRHIAEGEQRVARQTALIAELASHGYDTTDAELLLKTLQDTLNAMYDHLQLIRDEIQNDPPLSST